MEGPIAQCHLVRGDRHGLAEPRHATPTCTRIIFHWPPMPYKGDVLALAATHFAPALEVTSPLGFKIARTATEIAATIIPSPCCRFAMVSSYKAFTRSRGPRLCRLRALSSSPCVASPKCHHHRAASPHGPLLLVTTRCCHDTHRVCCVARCAPVSLHHLAMPRLAVPVNLAAAAMARHRVCAVACRTVHHGLVD